MRKPSKGRQVIKIEYILDPTRRQVTFSKRKAGLFKKASELSLLCDAAVAVVIFSEAGKPYAIGSPSVDHVLRRFAPLPGDGHGPAPFHVDDRAEVEAAARQLEEAKALVDAEKLRMRAVGDRVTQAAAGRQYWWEADVEALGAEELPEFTSALQRLRANVSRKVDELLAAPQPPTAGPPALKAGPF